MRSDTEIKMQAFQVLFQSLGSLETERFISIIKRNNFDYTKWREFTKIHQCPRIE